MRNLEHFIFGAKWGSQQAFKGIIYAYRTLVYQLVRKYSKDEEQIAETVKLVFNVMWENIGYFEQKPRDFTGWVMDLVVNVCVFQKHFVELDEEEREEQQIDILTVPELIVKEIKKYYASPEQRKKSLLKDEDLKRVLGLDDYMLIMMKYMYIVSIEDIATEIEKRSTETERLLMGIERKIVFYYRNNRIYENFKATTVY